VCGSASDRRVDDALVHRDLETRSAPSATIQDPLEELVQSGSESRIAEYFNRLTRDEGLYAMGLCKAPYDGSPVTSINFPPELTRCANWADYAGETSKLVRTAHGSLNVSVRPLPNSHGSATELILVHDMNFVDRRNEETRLYLFYFFLALGACVALITIIIVQVSWRGWVSGLRALLRGDGIVRRAGATTVPELQPIARDPIQLDVGQDRVVIRLGELRRRETLAELIRVRAIECRG
jgi:trehalose 6-phosphate synthase